MFRNAMVIIGFGQAPFVAAQYFKGADEWNSVICVELL